MKSGATNTNEDVDVQTVSAILSGASATLVNPVNGGNVSISEINGRQYLDLTFNPSASADARLPLLMRLTSTLQGSALGLPH